MGDDWPTLDEFVDKYGFGDARRTTVPKDNGHTLTVDEEVHSIVTRYAQINGISISEALRRLILNAQAEESEASDGVPDYVGDSPF